MITIRMMRFLIVATSMMMDMIILATSILTRTILESFITLRARIMEGMVALDALAMTKMLEMEILQDATTMAEGLRKMEARGLAMRGAVKIMRREMEITIRARGVTIVPMILAMVTDLMGLETFEGRGGARILMRFAMGATD